MTALPNITRTGRSFPASLLLPALGWHNGWRQSVLQAEGFHSKSKVSKTPAFVIRSGIPFQCESDAFGGESGRNRPSVLVTKSDVGLDVFSDPRSKSVYFIEKENRHAY